MIEDEAFQDLCAAGMTAALLHILEIGRWCFRKIAERLRARCAAVVL